MASMNARPQPRRTRAGRAGDPARPLPWRTARGPADSTPHVRSEGSSVSVRMLLAANGGTDTCRATLRDGVALAMRQKRASQRPPGSSGDSTQSRAFSTNARALTRERLLQLKGSFLACPDSTPSPTPGRYADALPAAPRSLHQIPSWSPLWTPPWTSPCHRRHSRSVVTTRS